MIIKHNIITGNRSWWKNLKYRKEAVLKLLTLRKRGYRLKSTIRNTNNSVNTNIYTTYKFYVKKNASKY